MSHEVFEYDRQTLPRSLADFPFDDSYRSPLLAAAPAFDGTFRPEEWALAARFDGFSHKGISEQRRTVAYVGATRTHLYLAVLSELPPGGELVADVTAHSDQLVWDDAVEVWIDPDPGADDGVTYQLLTNSRGIDAYLTHPRGKIRPDQTYGWHGNYRFANGVTDSMWCCQIEVPLANIAADRRITDGSWGINVCRDYKHPWAFGSLGNRGFSPGDQIVFRFCDGGAAAVQTQHRTDPVTRTVDAVLSIFNPGPLPLELSAQLFLKRDKMPEVSRDERLALQPGQRAELSLHVQDGVSDVFDLFVLVKDGTGAVQHSRYYQWGPPREARWDVHKTARPPVDFAFAYYPYLNRMTIRLDTSALDPAATLEAVDIAIRRRGEADTVHQFRITASQLRNHVFEVTFDLPPLDGDYEIIAQSLGQGVPPQPLMKQFQRTIYEWEHGQHGKSRTVYPPFTPIEVQGRTLKTVMKEYDLGGCGLLDQVRTDDQQRLGLKQVLAGPMRYITRVNGVTMEAEPETSQIIATADDCVIATGRCTAALPLQWKSTLEYDGMLRVDLTLASTETITLQQLDLEIPIHASVAKFLHAMADGIRYPIRTGALPTGNGLVWSASQLLSSDYPANFATYVFLGDASRGICWFAENDLGWSWNPATPNAEIFRNDDRVTLVIHLVNEPIPAGAPRTLTFGIQASPVKPLTRGWRHRWETEKFSVIGTDIHWFGLGNCASVYPAAKDLSLWETLKKSTLEPLGDAEIEQTISRARGYFSIRGESTVEYMASLARKTLRSRLGKKVIFYYNRSAAPGTEEFQTFMDEWCTGEYNPHRGSNEQFEVKIIPSDSYIDYALHWYVKSFAHSPNIGVYVDNIFFCAGRNRTMTNAYRRADGSVMPSTGIWQLRELAKRTFVMLNEQQKEPLHMVHLTSVMILPVMSFYTIQYDWEWHFSQGDVQDRFQREYLLTVSSGAHLGAWPIVLHEQGRCVADEWTLRTYLAVAIVHELIVDPYVWDVEVIPTGDTPENRLFATLRQPILDLCQHADRQVWRYWDARPQPIQIGNPSLLGIVYSRPGQETLIAITSFLAEDTATHIQIDFAALGLLDSCLATNIETSEVLSIVSASIRLQIKRHDIQMILLRPQK